MDPKACLARLLDAIKEREWDEAAEAARDLTRWIERGGFAPERSARAVFDLIVGASWCKAVGNDEHARALTRCRRALFLAWWGRPVVSEEDQVREALEGRR